MGKLGKLLFADDTVIAMSGDDPQILADNFNLKLRTLSEWMHFNKLLINVEKTKCVLFTNKKTSTLS